ncbi:hypothetical protein BGW42_005190 [Actinomortierella wolfii]|nr:hypothetical protein BGW42_005190 [Actinomortierella wolfii]
MVRLSSLVAFILLSITLHVATHAVSPQYTFVNRGLWARTIDGETRREDRIELVEEPNKFSNEYLWEVFPIPYDKSLFRIKNAAKGYTVAALTEKSGSEVVAKLYGASNWRIEMNRFENKYIIRLDGTNLVWTRNSSHVVLYEYQNRFSQLWGLYRDSDWYGGLYTQ